MTIDKQTLQEMADHFDAHLDEPVTPELLLKMGFAEPGVDDE